MPHSDQDKVETLPFAADLIGLVVVADRWAETDMWYANQLSAQPARGLTDALCSSLTLSSDGNAAEPPAAHAWIVQRGELGFDRSGLGMVLAVSSLTPVIAWLERLELDADSVDLVAFGRGEGIMTTDPEGNMLVFVC
jgi:hypothetical protein